MDSPLAIGIDLGTTYCCVAVLRHGEMKPEVIPNDVGKDTTPSFVAYDADGDIYSGQTAKDLAFDNPDSTVFDVKRLIGRSFFDPHIQKFKNLWPFSLVNIEGLVGIKVGENNILPQTIAKELIAHLRQISENYLACPIKSAVVTIPAYFNDLQQGLTRQACHEAGLETVHFITEPTAAAYAYGLQSSIQPDQSKTCLIFDLGGGTFDITIFKLGSQKRVEILATGGDARLGGEDFNDLLTEYCINEFKRMHSIDLAAGKNSEDAAVRLKTEKLLRKIRTDCEKKKIHLSNIKKVTISVDAVARELDMVIPVTRKIFEDLIDDHLKRCIDTMDNILKKSQIGMESIDNVVLIGGSSRIPKVQQLVSEFFGGKELLKNINADEAVACGAAVYAFSKFNKSITEKTVTVLDLTAHIESYGSTDSIQIQQSVAVATIKTHSTEVTDRSEELLFKDLQTIKVIIIKHKKYFFNKSVDIHSWSQNFQKFENDFKNSSKAAHFGREMVISGMLDIPLLPELAKMLWDRYEYMDALKLNEVILKRRTSLVGVDHLDTIESQFQVAKCLDELNSVNNTRDASNALDLYQIVLEKRKRILGESHKETLIVEYWIATVLENHGMYQDALNLAEKVYKLQCIALGPEHIETLQTHVWVALCLIKMQNHKEAIKLGLNLYHKLKLLTDDISRTVFTSKGNVAFVLKQTNRLDEALSLYEDIYRAKVTLVGEDHLKTITTKEKIALCLYGLREYKKALEIHTSVLNKRKEVLGPNHRDTIRAEHEIACSLYKQGKQKEAQELFQQVYEKKRIDLGKDDPSTLVTLGWLELLDKGLKDYVNK